jgi:phospholipid transport system substrate-binding protein
MGQSALADDKTHVEQLIKSKLDAVILALAEKDLSLQEKNDRIDKIVSPIFDFPLMAMLTLGRKYWPGMSKEKQDRFTELFVKRLKDSYSEKLTRYTNEKIIYDTPVQVKNKISIPTYVISKDSKISILYKLYKTKDDWKIYDIEIEGVSIIQTYRSQFSQVLETGTIDDLLVKLQEPVES